MARKNGDDEKSCGPQHLVSGEPSSEWAVDELGRYAQMQHQQIADGEKLLTASYWRLGHALELAKMSFNHGQWTKYLDELKIDPTRASKARAIYRTFGEEEEVAGLTVEEAYDQRERQQAKKPEENDEGDDHPQADVKRLRRFVTTVSKGAEEVIHDATFAEPEDAEVLIPAIRKAIGQLQDFLGRLEEQAADGPEAEQIEESGSKEPPQ